MPFEFQPLPIAGPILVKPQVFGDDRGFFLETYKQSAFEAAGIPGPFVQDNQSRSARGVLRGIHYQVPPHAQGKLVWVTEGAVWDVCADLRRSSPTFGQWSGVHLRAEEHTMLYLPPGFGHGFVVLSDTADFLYKCTAEYSPAAERGVRWDDPDLAIDWPLEGLDVTVSTKDAALPLLADVEVFEEPIG